MGAPKRPTYEVKIMWNERVTAHGYLTSECGAWLRANAGNEVNNLIMLQLYKEYDWCYYHSYIEDINIPTNRSYFLVVVVFVDPAKAAHFKLVWG